VVDVSLKKKTLGLDAVDWVTTYGMPAAELRRITDSFGLKAVCHTFYADFNADTEAARRSALDSVRRGLEDAAVLGAPCAMAVIPGRRDCPRDQARKRISSGLREAVCLAQTAGITLTIEPFPGDDSPFVTSSELREMVTSCPGLKITYDAGNLLTGGEDPVAGYLALKEEVVFAHFKDWVCAQPPQGRMMVDGRRYAPALVGEGVVNYPALLAAMRQTGYTGYANIEYEGDAYPPHDATARALDYLRRVDASFR